MYVLSIELSGSEFTWLWHFCKALFCFDLRTFFDFFVCFCFAVVGEKEVQSGAANIRTRDNKVHGEHSIEAIIGRFKEFQETKCLDAEEKF